MNRAIRWGARILAILSFSAAIVFDIRCQETLTIATFNCEFLTLPKVHVKFGLPFDLKSADKKVQKDWDKSEFRSAKFEEAATVVGEFLASLNADVLALTEVGNLDDMSVLQHKLLQLGAEYPYLEVGKSQSGNTAQNVAVLSKFPLKDPVYRIPGREGYLEEPDDPETENDTGISKGMRVTVHKEGRDFILYVLHLQSERGGHGQDQQRIAQASIVRRHALPHLQNGELVIIAGDLNDHRGQPTLNRIRGLDDIYEDLIQTGHKEYFETNAWDTRWTYEFEGIRGQIDHILLSYSIKDLCQSPKNIRARTVENKNDLVSDHNPLIVHLTFPDH